MNSVLNEFQNRTKFIDNLHFNNAKARLTGLYKWLITTKETKNIIDKIINNSIIESEEQQRAPSTQEEIVSFGLFLLKKISEGTDVWRLGYKYDIRSPYGNDDLQGATDAVIENYINPLLEYIEEQLEKKISSFEQILLNNETYDSYSPPEIKQSSENFFMDYPDIERNAFIMMRFGKTKAHINIYKSIKETLNKYKINALRADEKEYHEDLFPNVLTYIYGSSFGIAVFERLEEDVFNPNVSLEVGYMRALRKPVCLLKDRTLKTLQTDLVGKLYKTFDPQEPKKTIPGVLEKWLFDKNMIT